MMEGDGFTEHSAGGAGPFISRLVVALLLGTLLLLGYRVVESFLTPLLWAAILAYLTWPLNRRLRRVLQEHRGAAALLMTLLLTIAIILPLLALLALLREELEGVVEWARDMLEGGAGALPSWLRGLPWVGPRLMALADRVSADPEMLGDLIAERGSLLLGGAADIVGGVGRNAMKLGIALLAVFFIYREGERLVAQTRSVLCGLLGVQTGAYWTTAAKMIQAVVYGLVLTAIAQGALAGIGYWGAGLEAPALFGMLTALFAIVPFGAPLVWVSVSLYLLWQGALWPGIGLLVWGALAVSSVDNLIRPLVISVSARIPFLLVLFGVLGGLAAFGLVGLFLGPVVLAILLAVWRHWLENNAYLDGGGNAAE